MQYRIDVGEKGILAKNANYRDLVSAGMTDTHKVSFNNSVVAPVAVADPVAVAAPVAAPVADAAPVAAPVADAAPVAAAEPAAVATAEAAAKVAPATAALMQKMDTIGEPKYDWDVYRFSK
jgi:hypothetical protein